MEEIKDDYLYDEQHIFRLVPDLKLVSKVGRGMFEESLYFSEEKKVYFEKGAFGTHDAVCFKKSKIKDLEEARKWLQDMTEYWKKTWPGIPA